LGLVIASLIAAYMSTISTHLNWGSSYVVNDWYKRFINPTASGSTEVLVGRISTLTLMILSAVLALFLSNALQAFNILLQIGAGTGLIFILRWFWWRINAYSELAAMVISFFIALYFEFIHTNVLEFEALESHYKLIIGVIVTTIGWVIVTFLTQPTEQETLLKFYKLIRPAAGGWKPVIERAEEEGQLDLSDVRKGKLPLQVLGMLVGCTTVYAALFGTGFWIYGQVASALFASGVAVLGGIVLFRLWGQLKEN
ncbi:MAG: Na+:solute symporter, partial [Bacteroidota bacterium]